MFGKYDKFIYIICAVIYVIFGVIITNYATDVMSKSEFSLFAGKAKGFAVLASKTADAINLLRL
jgi:hypothetical protein